MIQLITWYLWRRWRIYCPDSLPKDYSPFNPHTFHISPCSLWKFGIQEDLRTGQQITITPFPQIDCQD